MANEDIDDELEEIKELEEEAREVSRRYRKGEQPYKQTPRLGGEHEDERVEGFVSPAATSDYDVPKRKMLLEAPERKHRLDIEAKSRETIREQLREEEEADRAAAERAARRFRQIEEAASSVTGFEPSLRDEGPDAPVIGSIGRLDWSGIGERAKHAAKAAISRTVYRVGAKAAAAPVHATVKGTQEKIPYWEYIAHGGVEDKGKPYTSQTVFDEEKGVLAPNIPMGYTEKEKRALMKREKEKYVSFTKELKPKAMALLGKATEKLGQMGEEWKDPYGIDDKSKGGERFKRAKSKLARQQEISSIKAHLAINKKAEAKAKRDLEQIKKGKRVVGLNKLRAMSAYERAKRARLQTQNRYEELKGRNKKKSGYEYHYSYGYGQPTGYDETGYNTGFDLMPPEYLMGSGNQLTSNLGVDTEYLAGMKRGPGRPDLTPTTGFQDLMKPKRPRGRPRKRSTVQPALPKLASPSALMSGFSSAKLNPNLLGMGSSPKKTSKRGGEKNDGSRIRKSPR